jgi:kynurenine formamidase
MRMRSAVFLVLVIFSDGGAMAEDWIDLTHPFDASTVYWPTEKPFSLTVEHKGKTPGGWWYEANRVDMAEHGGTHIDAPVHFAEGKWSVDQIPLDRLIGPAVVVDISEKAKSSRDAQLTSEDLKNWETKNGRLPDDIILLVHTGWSRFWPDKKKVLGTDKPGDVANLHFPGIAPEAAEWLVRERRLRMLGIDTPSIDFGQSKDFRTHQILSARNLVWIENVAALDKLPVKGAVVHALPMKIKGGSGAPCRVVARLPGR